MDNTRMTEQVTEDQYYEALTDSLFHFNEWLGKIEDDKAPDQSENVARFEKRFESYKDGILKQVYMGFDAGFNAAMNMIGILLEQKESSESTATPTETTK